VVRLPRGARVLISSPKCLLGFWVSPSFLGPSPKGNIAGWEGYHSFLSSAKVKNEWSFTSTQPYSYFHLYLNLKAIEKTTICAFKKGIFGYDESGKTEWRLHMQ
jgi:hypothetical protein